MLNPTKKIALVTGCSRGLGRAIALELAKEGFDLVLNDLQADENLENLAKEIQAKGQETLLAVADVSDEAAVGRLFEELKSHYGRLDVLVNNAGISRAETIEETSLESWQQVLNVNLTSMFLCSKQAISLMKENPGGRIVNLSSIVGHRGALFGHSHYAASKAGILGFTKTLARTGAPYGITVNAVAPGIIKTDLLQQIHGEEKIKTLADSVPLGLGKPRDIAMAVAFLCGEGGQYITGTTLDVDGGMGMR